VLTVTAGKPASPPPTIRAINKALWFHTPSRCFARHAMLAQWTGHGPAAPAVGASLRAILRRRPLEAGSLALVTESR